MRSKRIIHIILVLVGCFLVKCWVGVYSHDEFGGYHLFLKHKPIWKTYFFSPQGMRDLKLDAMSPEDQKEQLLFNAYVKRQGLSR